MKSCQGPEICLLRHCLYSGSTTMNTTWKLGVVSFDKLVLQSPPDVNLVLKSDHLVGCT